MVNPILEDLDQHRFIKDSKGLQPDKVITHLPNVESAFLPWKNQGRNWEEFLTQISGFNLAISLVKVNKIMLMHLGR